MASGDVEQGRVPNEEDHFQSAERGKKGVNELPSICMIPRVLRNLSEESFTPMVVSIGPLHKDDENLQELEGLKDYSFRHLLPIEDLRKKCLEKVEASMVEIRLYYDDGVNEKYKDGAQLAKMMVQDGCFILLFCLEHYDKWQRQGGAGGCQASPNRHNSNRFSIAWPKIFRGLYSMTSSKESKKPYPGSAPDYDKSIFLNNLQNGYIARDLILLENQIPFFVLEEIFNRTISQRIGNSLTYLLRWVIGYYTHPFDNSFDHPDFLEKFSVKDVSKDDPDHILDCLHKCYHLPKTEEVTETCCLRVNCCRTGKKKKEPAVHSVVELERSGVNFESHTTRSNGFCGAYLRRIMHPISSQYDHHQEEKQGMTMKFKRSPFPCFYGWSWSKPSLLMPKLVIEDFTEVVLRNFIAYEQSFPKVKYYFTSYAYVMDKLIDSQADVGKLVESKVLVNNLGSNMEAADMINSISKKIYVEDVYYPQVIQDLDKYYNGKWPNYIAYLRRTYFNSPWNFIALLAGITLFVLTVVQTIFTVMSYNP